MIPYRTGSHLQLVRTFYSAANGLPADPVRAVAVTREGATLAGCGSGLVRLEGERWLRENGPSEVTALFAPRAGPLALAGTTNGVWRLGNTQWQLEEASPGNVIAFAAEPDGIPWALAPSGVWRRAERWQKIHTIEDDVLAEPHSLLPAASNDVLVAAETGLFSMAGKRRYWLKLEEGPGRLLGAHARALTWLDPAHFLVGTEKGLSIANWPLGRGWHSLSGSDGLAIPDITHGVADNNGTVWLGSQQGLMRWKNGIWTYLAGKRWLPDDRILALASAKDGSVWTGTPKGLAHIFERRLTLSEKAELLQSNLQQRNRRHGYVTQMHLTAPGVLENAIQEVSDNDGLWTALYIAAQSYRYAVTKSQEAKAQAWRSMQALLRLESITGLSGFPARAICHTNEPQFRFRGDPEWHPSAEETGWYWKGETSSDEIVGHYFGWYVFYELAADEEQKNRVRATCKRVTDHILAHGYYLMDQDGTPTTWGFWGPDRLNDDPKYWEERCLGSLEILSHLKVAMRLVGDPRYERAYDELIRTHHYALNTLPGKVLSA